MECSQVEKTQRNVCSEQSLEVMTREHKVNLKDDASSLQGAITLLDRSTHTHHLTMPYYAKPESLCIFVRSIDLQALSRQQKEFVYDMHKAACQN